MSDDLPPLKDGEVGTYPELRRRPLPTGMAIHYMPSLVAILTNVQNKLGRPLTREQVLAIRDEAVAMVCPAPMALALQERRGYADLDPADPWTGWRAMNDDADA